MEAIEALLTRRSIRKFTDQSVTDEQVDTILKAAMYAPSAGNTQPWHFVVVRDRELLDKVTEFHPYAKMILQSPVAILVCGDQDLQKFDGFWIQDCSAATENLLLAAHSLGLGAVWLGVHPRPERIEGARKLFELPDNILPLSLIPIGYPDESKPDPGRFKPERIHLNKW